MWQRLRWIAPLLVSLVLTAGGRLARAQAVDQHVVGQVTVGDLQGSNGKWQTGEVVVAAPVEVVQGWFSDASHWSQRFPDDSDVRDEGRTADGQHVVRFHSAALGKTLTVTLKETPGLITYTGVGQGVSAQGKIFFQSVDATHTRIISQTTGELHGITGLVAPETLKRKRAVSKLTADLNAAVKLSKDYAASPHHAG
jgi:hypothetical protein